MKKALAIIIALIILVVVIVAGIWFLQNNAGVKTESNESIIIHSVENIGEIALLQLNIEDIYDRKNTTNIPKIGELIGSERKMFLRVSFDAKLGINGNEIEINPKGNNIYEITVPPFIFIGYNNFNSEVAAEDKGILSWTNKEIKESDIINDILGKKNKQKYLVKYDDQLKESTELFFTQLIKGIDPDAVVTFTFAD